MKQILIIIALCFYILSFGQIEIKIISLKKEPKGEKLSVSITNLTNDYYVVPFDESSFKGYNSEEVCNDLKTLDYPYNFFALSLIFKDKMKNEPENSLTRSFHPQDLDQKEADRVHLKYQKKKEKLISWKKKNNFQTDLEAERNFYIMNNLLFLSPKEKKILNLEMDIFTIMRGDTMFYDYYNLQNGKEYNFNVKLCADRNIYNYLTEKQKHYLQKYKFFEGQLESNTLPYYFSYYNSKVKGL
ncbi:hypothetical protein M2347_002308 [Chryseobacterium sp. H1D6B]|uniref:hypothetical protein n=1 Tax=Chryseobacterium sp. H1D6B TaxID=2940588 RepID=UPI0015CA4FC3|nr:hypothetical protein [Chryseobacterium sp. H1D6B]MDH6252581.1 hypothetical protein [Chryseobacterium sp. H1D6B]